MVLSGLRSGSSVSSGVGVELAGFSSSLSSPCSIGSLVEGGGSGSTSTSTRRSPECDGSSCCCLAGGDW